MPIKRRGELQAPDGQTLANIWADVEVVDADKHVVRVRLVHDHASLASIGCFWIMPDWTLRVTETNRDHWLCVPADPAKAGEA